jgi:anti-sigma regulatory factor (Ser/Thr protein kinase)
MTLALSAHAPKQVRDSFDGYRGSIDEALLDDLRILSSELVTNAVQHSGRPEGDPIEVTTTVGQTLIRVEVTDSGNGIEPLQPRSTNPPSGLGYVALLSDRWSSSITHSFRVWFEIDVRPNGLVRRK